MKFIFVYLKDVESISAQLLRLIQKKLSNEYSIYENTNMFEFIECHSTRYMEIQPYILQNLEQNNVLSPNWYVQNDDDPFHFQHINFIIEFEFIFTSRNNFLEHIVEVYFEKIDEILQTRIPVLK